MTTTESRLVNLRQLVAQADKLRRDCNWVAALSCYRAAMVVAPKTAVLRHNTALCLHALKRDDEALDIANQALELDPSLWQSRLIQVRILRKQDRIDEALQSLTEEIRTDLLLLDLERAEIMMNDLGNAALAAEIVAPYLDNNNQPQARLRHCLASFYDRGEMTAEQLSQKLSAYSAAFNNSSPVVLSQQQSAVAVRRRIRVGIISPQLRATPVFFLGIGALRLLSNVADLVFFHRGAREDWVTPEFKKIANEWVDVATLNPIELSAELQRHTLDILIDMGGWMDVPALQALSTKPVHRQYKWIGGQSATTGLRSFDGFLSDIEQSPLELQSLYTESLILLDSGYVTYSKPSYFPVVQAPSAELVLGVISNPAKISRVFLDDLASRLRQWKEQGVEPKLRFIEKRYRYPALQQRIRSALADLADLDFVIPDGHIAYLNEVAGLDTVIDTYPYTGGLTTIEALMLGVPCRTRNGKLFCERHTYAHCRYAGMEPQDFILDGWIPEKRTTPSDRLMPSDSPRLNHDRLAHEMLKVFTHQ